MAETADEDDAERTGGEAVSARPQIVCVDSKPYRFKGASRDHGLEFWLLDRSRFVVGRGICFGPVRMEDVARELARVREVGAVMAVQRGLKAGGVAADGMEKALIRERIKFSGWAEKKLVITKSNHEQFPG